jgi:hypothetical protein
MLATVDGALAELEGEEGLQRLPENITALPLLQMAYRGQVQLTPQQMRAAIEALPFEVPKLGVTANVTVDGSFAERLERALERSSSPVPRLNGPKTVEHEELVTANDLKKPFQRNYRRFTSPR